ncbi:glycosyltransferase family 4 protein [Micromonospora mirobrigensis]|uniref:Glycosyl transferases group 1 n=1 Tax=Micromonospora mirobrigensis TaxID=262898 RepID=A0A1C4UGT0_9ACTN|nr:glycosyltransferase family 4 protein [Micromonospora mirobrigensis]SCE70821.1 hypothetical protein GA0070564_101461 [Micromonospora mirobrigensis]
MDTASPERVTPVVLLRDGRWPDLPGVCCWRNAFRAAFTAAGASVTETSWQPPPKPQPKRPAPPQQPKMPWLAPSIRQPLVKVYRRSRRMMQQRRPAAAPVPPPPAAPPAPKLLPGLEGAALVVAESPRAAAAALAGGTPGRLIWSLALPAERIVQGAESGYADELDAVAGKIGGFITDSELARESVERATVSARPRVVVLPPLAADRTCPSCADAADDELPAGVAPEAEELAVWRRLLRPGAPSVHDEMPYSFAAARLRGTDAAWAPANRLGWDQEAKTIAVPGLPETFPTEWTAAEQDRGAGTVLAATLPQGPAHPERTLRTVISGYDLKFIRELAHRLDARTDLDVTLDDWPKVSIKTPRTQQLADDSDVIIAEWARPSAAWFAERKKPNQFLVVRLHRFELDAPYPALIDIDKVDAVVHVSPPIGRRIRNELNWPAEKLVYIPNFLDVEWVDRPKLPEARFNIGFVGMEWSNKRFDLALDLLAEVRRQDRRFTMFVRSLPPWQNEYVWPKAEEREYVGWCQERIDRDPLLRGAVVFDAPGRDMGRWYRKVGNILSMSDIESFHLGCAEGMASGAVPVIRPWPGARDIYDNRWIPNSIAEAAESVLANADPQVWAERSAAAHQEMLTKVNPTGVIDAWAALLHGDVAKARGYFADYSTR